MNFYTQNANSKNRNYCLKGDGNYCGKLFRGRVIFELRLDAIGWIDLVTFYLLFDT